MNDTLKRNVNLFHVYRFISRFYTYLPILVTILLSFKLSYLQVSLAVAIHGFTIMVFKFPLKYILKKVHSIKKIIFVGEIAKAIGILLLAFSGGNLISILLGQVMNGIGFALTTSTESALLFNQLKFYNSEDQFRSIEGKSQALSFVSCFLAGILGSIIADSSIMIPLLIAAICAFLSSGLILLFEECRLNEVEVETKESIKENMSKVSHVLYFYALNRGIIIAIFVYVLPLFLQEEFNLSIVYFGMILGLFSLTAFIVGNNIDKISKAFKGLWIAVPLCLVLAIIILSMRNIYLLFMVPVLLGFAGITVRPLSVDYINSHIEGSRSLIMSRGEQYFGILNAIFILTFGILFHYTNAVISLYVFLGLILVGCLFIGLFALGKIKKFNEAENLQL